MTRHLSLRELAFLGCTAIAIYPTPGFAEPPALSPASSAEIQKLLAVPNTKTPTPYANRKLPRDATSAFDRLFVWNEIALDTTAIDHTPPPAGATYVFGQQFGPTRTSRAMAIAHIAMFEAVNALTNQYQSYVGLAPQTGNVSIDYAISQSAHDALVYLYPSQQPRLDALLALDVALIQGTPAQLAAGRALGQQAAAAIVALRTNDGSQIPEPTVGGPFTPIGGAGHWSIDPIVPNNIYLGAYWNLVKPFVMTSASQFRAPPPPALTSQTYTTAFNAVKTLGGDPTMGTPTTRTKAQTVYGIYWTYDGVPELCAPPRLYNQVIRAVALQHGLTQLPQAARYLAVINTAMADAAISAWDTKWHYQFWRPVTGIRSPDQGGNTQVVPNPNWYPLGGQATDTKGPNFTPPFPAYVSGHATFGGAIFQIMRHYFGENAGFTFVSDEYNGLNRNDRGQLQPFLPQYFPNMTSAEAQNGESRIWIGVHWQFDDDMGVIEGHSVGDWVDANAFQPRQVSN